MLSMYAEKECVALMMIPLAGVKLGCFRVV